ncbi:MAG: hypothetical protein WBP95_11160 [Acidobacteriaceae bacterium]
MTFASETATATVRVLNRCFEQVKQDGPWRWQCVAQNGARLPVEASLEDGFLHLACDATDDAAGAECWERALFGNESLAGCVKFALDARRHRLDMRADIAVVDEEQLQRRLRGALDGLHRGAEILKVGKPEAVPLAEQDAGASVGGVAELLRESAWTCTERGAGDFSVELDAESLPPARIRAAGGGLTVNVELVRLKAVTGVVRDSLAVFLLTATGGLRLVRAYGVQREEQEIFGLQVGVPTAPAIEEIEHGLAALSFAYRVCTREANLLLDETAAQSYLASRDFSSNQQNAGEKEN